MGVPYGASTYWSGWLKKSEIEIFKMSASNKPESGFPSSGH